MERDQNGRSEDGLRITRVSEPGRVIEVYHVEFPPEIENAISASVQAGIRASSSAVRSPFSRIKW